MTTSRTLGLGLVLLTAMSTSAAARHHHEGKDHDDKDHERHHATTLLAFNKMFGVDGAFVGDANPVDDIPGDELPWEIESARGRLDVDGELRLVVRGVVFKDDPSVPEELRGINDEDEFRAAVSCLTDEDGQVVRRKLVSEGFPTDESGDADIHTKLAIPDPCIAPAVFVLAGSEDKWFTVTGFETEEEE